MPDLDYEVPVSLRATAVTIKCFAEHSGTAVFGEPNLKQTLKDIINGQMRHFVKRRRLNYYVCLQQLANDIDLPGLEWDLDRIEMSFITLT